MACTSIPTARGQAVLDTAYFLRGTYPVTKYGAVGDGATENGKAIAAAIAAAAGAGGGTVVFPKGRWLTGNFNLSSNVRIQVSEGATILASGDRSQYPMGVQLGVVYGVGVTNAEVTGGGVIDGQGHLWWPSHPSLELSPSQARAAEAAASSAKLLPNDVPTPFLIEVKSSDNVALTDVTLLNSPMWCVHPYNISGFTMRNVTIDAPIWSPNTDCVDPDSSNNVLITNCTLGCGDDHVSVKASRGIPTYNVLVSNTTFLQGQGMTIGSMIAGSMHNVTFKDSVMRGGQCGIRFKSERNLGGTVEKIAFQNLAFETVSIMISINMAFNHGGPAPNASLTPIIRDVWIDNVTGWGIASGLMNCLPESPCSGWTISNTHTRYCQDQMCTHISGTWHNVTTTLGQVPCSELTPTSAAEWEAPFVPYDVTITDF